MNLKFKLVILLSALILTSCGSNSDTAVQTTAETAVQTTAETPAAVSDENSMKIYLNGSEVTEEELKEHDYFSRIHTARLISKKIKTAEELFNAEDPLAGISYNEVKGDFDGDGTDETVISQKLLAMSETENQGKGYSFLWYCDELCLETYACGYGENNICKLSCDGSDFICLTQKGSAVKVFGGGRTDLYECVCPDGDLSLNGTELYVKDRGNVKWNDKIGYFVLKDKKKPSSFADETDEIFIKGQGFAEAYAEMSLNYLHGGAWDNYTEIKYFDFGNKSEGNYFEHEGIPFYKLLISKYTYDEMMEHIRSFYADEEAYEENAWAEGSLFVGKDNSIYVNGNEPTFIYGLRNKKAYITGYTVNADGSVTYDCYAESADETVGDLYFSFVLDSEGKLAGKVNDGAMLLFLPEEEKDVPVKKSVETEKYSVSLKISPFEESKLTAERRKLINSFMQNIEEEQLAVFLNERAEFYGTEVSMDNNEILVENIVFYDFDKDGTDEFLAELNFEMINLVSYYAVCYTDNGKTDFVTNGFTHNRIIHLAFADSQPFIIKAEAGMGRAEPVLKAEQVFTLVNGRFEPYTDSEKDIFVFVREKGNKLFLFDKSDRDACPMDEEISDYKYQQQLSFKDGVLTVADEIMLSFNLKDTDGIAAFIENELLWIDENLYGVVLGIPSVYMALYDIDSDNNPEFFLGYLIRDGIYWVHYNSDGMSDWGFSGSSTRPFLDGRLYIDSEGEEYYRTVEYIGNPTFRGAIISVIKNENGEWYVTDSETYNEAEFETTDGYMEIHAFEVEIDRSDIKGSVEKCFEGYYGNSVLE
ncbi:MAG: hypothetical protein IJZ72_03010 [Oscillospiraceae bacterium]|nr:hypothetical protein [Oscillospiraceae bacterium]